MFTIHCGSYLKCRTPSSSGVSSDTTAQPSEESISISSIQQNDQIPETIRKGAANSLNEIKAYSPTCSEAAAVPKLRSFLDWENQLLKLSTEVDTSSAAAKIHLRLGVLFKNRLKDIETCAANDLEAKLETYKEWVDVLIKFNRNVFEDLEELDKHLQALKVITQALSCLAHNRRDLGDWIAVLAFAFRKREFNFTGVNFDISSLNEILGQHDHNLPDSRVVDKQVDEN